MRHFSNGLYFKEVSHPDELGCQYELLYDFAFPNSEDENILPQIKLDFSETLLHCYINFERRNITDGSAKGEPGRIDLFRISIYNPREIDRAMVHIIFDDDPLDTFVNQHKEITGMSGLNLEEGKYFQLNKWKIKNKAFYFFFEDFETGSLFYHLSQYDEVYTALHNNFFYRAFLYKLKFLKYSDALSIDLSESKQQDEKVNSQLPADLAVQSNASISRTKKEKDPDNLKEIPSMAYEGYLLVVKEWTNILISSEYTSKIPIDKMRGKDFFLNPETELRLITSLTKKYSIEKTQPANAGKSVIKTKDLFGKLFRRKEIGKEKKEIEFSIILFLLKRYNVLRAVKISTNYSPVLILCCFLCLLFPALCALLIFFSPLKLISPIYLVLPGMLLCIVTGILLAWKAYGRGMGVKLMFPRLVIAIFSGWMIFVTAQELISTEIDVSNEIIFIGTAVIIVTCAFMYNGVITVAPYYKNWPVTSRRTVYRIILNRISLLVAASFMIAFYIGLVFQVLFVSKTIKQNNLIFGNMQEVSSINEIRSVSKEMNEKVQRSISNLSFQPNGLGMLADFRTATDKINESEKLGHALTIVPETGRDETVNPLPKQSANMLLISAQKELDLKKRLLVNWEKKFFNSSVENAHQKIVKIDMGKMEGYIRNITTNFNDSLNRFSLAIHALCTSLDQGENNGMPKNQLQEVYRIDNISRNISFLLIRESSWLNYLDAKITTELSELPNLYSKEHECNMLDGECKGERLVCAIQEKLHKENQMWVFSPNLVVYPKMLIFQSLFAMFFGIFFQLVLNDKTMTESL